MSLEGNKAPDFTLDDVIKFAIEREDTLYKLYRRAAELSTSLASK
jgi:hypothetical protein